MFEEHLIELVRENPVLYNLQDKHYKNVDVKEKIWKEISDTLGESVFQCKNKWKNLRDSYKRKTSKKVGSSGENNEDSKRTWKYEALLSFLDYFQYKRETIKSDLHEDDKFESTREELTMDETIQMSLDINSGPSLSTPLSSKKKRKRKADSTEFIDFHERVTKGITGEQTPTSINILFDALAKTIDDANLPANICLEIQHEVCNLVFSKIRDYI